MSYFVLSRNGEESFNKFWSPDADPDLDHLKPATGRPCVHALGDSGTVPAITSDCFRVAESLMRRRYFDLCVTASSRTMLTFENNVSCSSRDCSTIASSCR